MTLLRSLSALVVLLQPSAFTTRAPVPPPCAPGAPAPALLVRNARVFDGARVSEHTDVLVRGGRIAAVGHALSVPSDEKCVTVIDGRGRTLLPGLIDAHVHAFGNALREALAFGVTTQLDMFTDPDFARAKRAEQAAGRASGRADLYSAGILVTVPHGHGTEYYPIPTLTSADSAQAFVDARIAEGSDYIKIVYDDGRAYGISLPTLDAATMAAVVRAAHARGKLTVVHIGSLAGARDALAAGADGLAHLFVDQRPDPDFGRFVAAHHAFVVPTLTVLASVTGRGEGARLASDARIAPYLDTTSLALLRTPVRRRHGAPPMHYAAAEEAVRQLAAAGVPILAGTDAGNPGTAHGAALHLELELLVRAGLTPMAALAAATSVPARVFGLADRGRIEPGLRADLVLVDGDPTRDITATRAIVGIWKGGVRFDRARYRAAAAASRQAPTRPPAATRPVPADGVLSDFANGSTAISELGVRNRAAAAGIARARGWL